MYYIHMCMMHGLFYYVFVKVGTCVGVGTLAHIELYMYPNSGLSSYITRTIPYEQSSQFPKYSV